MNRLTATSLEFQSLLETACSDDATPADLARLEALANDESTIKLLVDFFQMDGELHRLAREEAGAKKCLELLGFDAGHIDHPGAGGLMVDAPAPVWDASPAGPLGYVASFFSSGWALAYLVAAIAFALGVFVGTRIDVSEPVQVAISADPIPIPIEDLGDSQAQSEVGWIAGVADCRLLGSDVSPSNNDVVPLGKVFEIESGLLEIRYNANARIILQGPATFVAESTKGGYLSFGKLTVEVEKTGAEITKTAAGGRRSAASEENSKIESPDSEIATPQSSAPLFTVRTPTAIVTDLGTEFGVEVDKQGVTRSQVFRGRVEMKIRHGDAEHPQQALLLDAGQSAQVGLDRDKVPRLTRQTGMPGGFVRRMPPPAPRLLLADSFRNKLPSSDDGAGRIFGLNEDLLDRQGGIYRPASYAVGGDFRDTIQCVQVDHHTNPGKLSFFTHRGVMGWVTLERDFPRNVEVRAELLPASFQYFDAKLAARWKERGAGRNSVGDNWIALGVRGRHPVLDNRDIAGASNAGAVIRVEREGKWAYFENGRRIAEGSLPKPVRAQIVLRVVGRQLMIQIDGRPLDLGDGAVRELPGSLAVGRANFISLGAGEISPMTPEGWLNASTAANLTVSEAHSLNVESPQSQHKDMTKTHPTKGGAAPLNKS